MCHAHVSEPRRGGSNIKVLNDDSIDNALDPNNITASRVGARWYTKGEAMTKGVKGERKLTLGEAIWD